MAYRRWARTLPVTLAVVLWMGLGLAVPIVVSLNTSDPGKSAVEAGPSHAFTLSAPIVLSDAPRVLVERGTAVFVDSAGKALTAAAPGAGGSQAHLRISDAVVVVGTSVPRSVGQAGVGVGTDEIADVPTAPLLANALASGRYETLSLRRATIVLDGLLETSETLTEVDADVSLRRRSYVAVKGTGLLRGRNVAFDVTIGGGASEWRGTAKARVPMRLTLRSDLVEATFDGRMSVSPDQIELQGHGELSMPSVRGLARWFGSYWPGGSGLREASVRGQVRLGRDTLTFENAVARMDGNEASGVLGLRVREPRPLLMGTLAYRVFDARPYLRAAATTAHQGGGAVTWSTLAGGVLSVPLGMHLDADLRISADRVVLGGLEIGRVAATIALKDGRLLADVPNMRLNGGEGGGQITADFTGFTPKVTLRGKVDEVDLGLMSAALAGGTTFQGRAGVVADLAGAGATLNDLLRGMAGKIAIRGQSPGRVGIDLRGLASAARDIELTGWDAATRGVTAYDGLDLRLVLRDGTVLTETADIRTPEGEWSATGLVNLLSDRIDLRLVKAGAMPGGAPGSTAPGLLVEMHGPLREPRVRASVGLLGPERH
jgi:hypothetical protein